MRRAAARHPVPAVVLALFLAACGPATGEPSITGSDAPSASAGLTVEGPPPCVDARFLWLPRLDRLVLANCHDQEDPDSVERLWAWDGAAWELLDDDGPPGRVVAGVAYDDGRDVIVRYGGLPLAGDDCEGDTWEWDGADWSQVEAASPPNCHHVKLAYDVARGVAVLTGGADADGDLTGGTYAWDGASWQPLTEEGPPPRAHFGFVHDAGHEGTLLYGGYDGDRVYDDFWAWDGEAWNEVSLAGPGPRSHAGMAVGPDGLMLAGGATGTSTFTTLTDATWLLTDGAWRQLDGEGPSARGMAALGWDEAREVFVLYGGFDADGAALTDLWEWDGAWRCVSGCDESAAR